MGRLRTGGWARRGLAVAWLVLAILAGALATAAPAAAHDEDGPAVLVFSKTGGFRHMDIPRRIAAMEAIGAANGFSVVATEDATIFNDTDLPHFAAVVFLATSDEILDNAQQAAFERYIRAGGGAVPLHTGPDTEDSWAWFHQLVGATFVSDPGGPQTATILVSDRVHPSTAPLPERWVVTDTFQNYTPNPRGDVHVLAAAETRGLKSNTMGSDKPVAWCHEFDGGRAWVTTLGHPEANYDDPLYREFFEGGIMWAAGLRGGDCGATVTTNFQKVALDTNTTDPMELAVLPDGRVLWIERSGTIKLYDPSTETTNVAGTINVSTAQEDGLLGIALDPNFQTNSWVYLFYSPKNFVRQHVSRFTLTGSTIDMASEKILLQIPTQRAECCHSAGSLAFGPTGDLYISTGDNTQHSAFTVTDERPGWEFYDAQRTSANTNDLRGKVLRIRPQTDGTYTIPPGNLFPPGTPGTKPEIFLMGLRNPFRITVDPLTGWLYTGDVGPDAVQPDPLRGPAGHDEIIQARSAGNHGWPYCLADNLPYVDYDYATGTSGVAYSCGSPVNDSPNNTGATSMPPSQSAYIWYTFDNNQNTDFPQIYGDGLGPEGGNTGNAGPVYRYRPGLSAKALPRYYDDTLFIYEWSRDWLMEVKLDANGNVLTLNRFLEDIPFNRPMDLEVGPDGALYLLEWGSGMWGGNDDAQLSRIEYSTGAQDPVAVAAATPTNGAVPLTVQFTATGSFDPEDGVALSYQWDFDADGTVDASGSSSASHTYTTAGDHTAKLIVTDTSGASGSAQVLVSAGNTEPEVTWQQPLDGSFFEWGRPISYDVEVTDAEDGTVGSGIASSRVVVQPLLGHNDHAHPTDEYTGATGTLTIDRGQHLDVERIHGLVEARYTDDGSAVNAPLTGQDVTFLRTRLQQAEFADSGSGTGAAPSADVPSGGADVVNISHGDHLLWEGVDLRGIGAVTFRVATGGAGGKIELRTGSPTGTLLGSVTVPGGGSWADYQWVTAPVSAAAGPRDLFVVFQNATAGGELFRLNLLHFDGTGVNVADTTAAKVVNAQWSDGRALIRFDERIDAPTAEDPANYTVDNGVDVVDAALLGDLQTVALELAPTPAVGVTHTVAITGVTDRSSTPNAVAAGTTATFVRAGDPVVVHRVNAGGPAVAGTPQWSMDTTTSPSPYVNTGRTNSTGATIDVSDPSVPAGTPMAVFQTERWDKATSPEMVWDFPVASGSYEVRVYLAEIWSGAAAVGARVFDVSAEGAVVFDDVDVFAEAGGLNKGLVKSATVSVTDGNLDLDFGHVVENPAVKAIEVVQLDGAPDPGGVNPTLGASPTSVAFGSVTVGASKGATVTVTNDGAAGDDPITVSDVDVTGSTAFTATLTTPVVLDPGESASIGVTFAPTAAGTVSGSLVVTHSGSNPAVSVPLSGTGTTASSEPTVVYRVNTGGGAVSGTPSWTVDTSKNPSPYVGPGSKFYSTSAAIDLSHASVPAGTPMSLFQNERWDPEALPEMVWDFPVASGSYEVRVYLAEIFSGLGAVGARVFDVSVEGSVVFDDVDVFAEAGGLNKGLVRSATVSVTDGNLDLDFGHVVENPAVKAIEVIRVDGAPDPGGVNPTLGASPTSVAFGSVAVGASKGATVTVTNDGAAGDDPITVSDVDVSGSAAFTATLTTPVVLDPGESASIGVTFAPTAAGTASGSLVVTHSGSNASVSVPLSGTGTTSTSGPTVVYRVNTGGGAVSGTPSWTVDTSNNPSPYVGAGSKFYSTSATIDLSHASVPAGTPVSLFQNERWDPSALPEMVWDFPVASGSYEVRVYLAEIFSGLGAVGKRVFDVSAEGSVVFDDVDVFAEAGGLNKGLVRSATVSVTDGNLDLDFGHVVENPAVKAIEIIRLP